MVYWLAGFAFKAKSPKITSTALLRITSFKRRPEKRASCVEERYTLTGPGSDENNSD